MASDDLLAAFGREISSLGSGNYSAGGRSYGQPINPTSPIYMGKSGVDSRSKGIPYAPGYQDNMFVQSPGSRYFDTDKNVSYGEAQVMPRDWDDKTMREFVNKGILYKVPGFNNDMGMPEILAAWDDMLQVSYAMNQGEPGVKWTPWDVLNSYADSSNKFGTKRDGDWIVDLNTGQRIKYVGQTKKTTTDKRIDLSSAEDVKALTTQMLREVLGRIPTADEIAQFRSSINTMEQANPEVVTTTTEFKPVAGGERGMELQEVGSTSTRSGGLGEAAKQLAIEESVRETPEYQKYQSGTTYFNAMMQMLSGGF